MNIKMYSVLDLKTGCFSHPFYEVTNGSAVRAFVDTAQNKDHPFNKHPEDYQLYYIGEFRDDTGSIVCVVPELLMAAINAVTE